VAAKDIISRDTLKRLTTDLARHLLGVDGEAIELLETQNQRVEDRRADLVARMRPTAGDEFLLHVEIANNNTSDMPLRMLRYYTDIRLAGHSEPLRQFLLYIGADRLTMPNGVREPEGLDYRYGLVDMHQVNCAGLLAQDNPDALVLAVLCDFGDREPAQIVEYIVRRLKDLLGSDERRFREYMTMLEILSENRDLEAEVAEAQRMLTQVDVKRLPSYKIGFEDGEETGEARGEARGTRQGEVQIVRRLLTRLDAAEVADLLGLTPEEVAEIVAKGGEVSPDPG
jgi:predicted transposase YdaD